MIGAVIIVFREVIEAGLIVGIILAATQKTPGRMPYIFGGVLAGLIGSAFVAGFAGMLSNALEGAGQEVFNASILGLAVIMLTWHNVWMARHGREMSEELNRIGGDIRSGSKTLMALAIVVGVAVLREGSEVVLFLYGVLISSGASGLSVFTGGVIGLLMGIALSAVTYSGLVIIPVRYLFRVTSLLIAFMAAGMATQAVAFLEQADLVTKFGRIVWNTSSILPENSIGGRVLHTLLGYTDQPTQLQLIAYLGTLAVIFILMKLLAPPPRQSRRLVTN
jgi:high-affinity iron transporter